MCVFTRFVCGCAVVLLGVSAALGQFSVGAPVADINGTPIISPAYVTEHDGQLYFAGRLSASVSETGLWRYNGTYAEPIAGIGLGQAAWSPTGLISHNGTLYFTATQATGGSKLWQYSTTGGAALAPGSAAQASLPEELTSYNGQLYFRATRFSNVGIELWKFDGATQTPIDIYPGTGSSYPQHFTEYNGLLYFNACGTPGQGTELWRTNGTTVTEAARIYPGNGSSPEHFAVYNNQLFFSAYDGAHGRELWRYNGSTATLAADIVPGGQYSSSNPSGMTVYNGKLYFSADDGQHGYELWSYDGVTAQMVAEINPTPNPGNGDTFLMDSSPGGFTVFDGKLYFSANDGVHGRELWSYDGTTPTLVADINAGQYGSEVSELTVYQDRLYFTADDGYVPGMRELQPRVFALSAVPEPATWLMLLSAVVAGVMGWHHRRPDRQEA